MAGGDASLGEGLGHRGDELQEGQTRVDVAGALAGFLDQRGNIVAGDVEQTLEALRLLVWVNVYALRVLDLSLVLQKLSMTSTTMESGTSWNLYL
jgi:hypothetical protein